MFLLLLVHLSKKLGLRNIRWRLISLLRRRLLIRIRKVGGWWHPVLLLLLHHVGWLLARLSIWIVLGGGWWLVWRRVWVITASSSCRVASLHHLRWNRRWSLYLIWIKLLTWTSSHTRLFSLSFLHISPIDDQSSHVSTWEPHPIQLRDRHFHFFSCMEPHKCCTSAQTISKVFHHMNSMRI